MAALVCCLDSLGLRDEKQKPGMGMKMWMTRRRRWLGVEMAWIESKWRLYARYCRCFSRWKGNCEQRGCSTGRSDYERVCAAYMTYKTYKGPGIERSSKSV